MKKSKTVIDAETALSAKTAEVAAAKETLKRLESELGMAYDAVRTAQTEADASMPQCRVVCINRYSGGEEDILRAVIVRRTPGGMLVVRQIGYLGGTEYKFKWLQHRALYTQAEKGSWSSNPRELRDVSAAYLPQTAQSA
jgi:hypothetical protein